jgi:uncharacterized protein YigE (DUF2233 family)
MVKKGVLFALVIGSVLFFQFTKNNDSDFITYISNSKNENIEFYWKDNNQKLFGSIQNLNQYLVKNNKEVLFITNGGMYKKDQSPQGLFIQNKITKSPIDTSSASGNFYLKPNGVFYLTTSKEAFVVATEDFKSSNTIEFATQSGPMLVVDGKIHSAFNKNSTNLNIRNGVGILPNNQVLFVLSKKEVNLYEFAEFFKNKGCKNALYLDGFVSRAYYPSEKWMQTDGNFGVMIAITKDKK